LQITLREKFLIYINEVIRLDEEWRKVRYDSDVLRKERNEAARGMLQRKN